MYMKDRKLHNCSFILEAHAFLYFPFHLVFIMKGAVKVKTVH